MFFTDQKIGFIEAIGRSDTLHNFNSTIQEQGQNNSNNVSSKSSRANGDKGSASSSGGCGGGFFQHSSRKLDVVDNLSVGISSIGELEDNEVVVVRKGSETSEMLLEELVKPLQFVQRQFINAEDLLFSDSLEFLNSSSVEISQRQVEQFVFLSFQGVQDFVVKVLGESVLDI
jgi:hypothetical protein